MGDFTDIQDFRNKRFYESMSKLYGALGESIRSTDNPILIPIAVACDRSVREGAGSAEGTTMIERFVRYRISLNEEGFDEVVFLSNIRAFIVQQIGIPLEGNLDPEPFAILTWSKERQGEASNVTYFNLSTEFLVAHMERIGTIAECHMGVPLGAVLNEYHKRGWRLIDHNYDTATRSNLTMVIAKEGLGYITIRFMYNILLEDSRELERSLAKFDEELSIE